MIRSSKLTVVLIALLATSACGFKRKKYENPITKDTQQPDKILYDRSVFDIQKGRYETARLTLNTLINTYDTSEYLAKAKLGIADSYYAEGGDANLIEAISEYNDFRTFFPFLDEAAYAQMQVAMAHYRMMEKADRDNTQTQEAEGAFQTFLLQYPQSPLVPQAEQHLRDVQDTIRGRVVRDD